VLAGQIAETQPRLPTLSVRGVDFAYRNQDGTHTLALRDVNLTVQREEFVSVVGPSGCGKSTLLRLLAGLMPPTRGSLAVNGDTTTRPRRNISLAFQKPTLLPWRTVIGNVLFPFRHMSLPVGDREIGRARELLGMMGLLDFADRRPGELSGGMQQRLALCRALVTEPDILLLDEPFSALDALTRDELGVELLRICTVRPKTAVLVTHSIPEAVLLSDRVCIMSSRPGTLSDEVAVTLPRPRRPEVMRDPIFQELTTHVRDLVQQHSRRRG
jgi:NitT/TauT family transport system ATP-binding protein